MEHRKLDALMSPMERIARVAAAGVSASRAQQTSPSGAISLDNADGTRTIIGEVSNGEANPSYTMATHVGDTTPPGIPTGITATSRSGVVVVEWDGTLSGGIPDDFFCVRIYLDGAELGALSEAGSVASAKLQSGTTVSVTATSEDDCCLPDGTPAHNVSEATQAISVTVAKDASEVMADIDEQIEGVEQEIADFKSNTYTKEQVNKKVDEGPDSLKSWITANYTNSQDLGTTYATKTLVSQTKEEIELSASQTYATKGIGNPNLSPFLAHDITDVYNATTNPDGYWAATPANTTMLSDGWGHVVMDNSGGSASYRYFTVAPLQDETVPTTILVEIRNLVTDAQGVPGNRLQLSSQNRRLAAFTTTTVTEDGSYYFPVVVNDATSQWFCTVRPYLTGGNKAEFDIRISAYASTEATIDGQQVTLPYEGSFKPYVTDQAALSKEYSTKAELTVGLDGIRQEVASEYQTIDGMGAYSTTAEMNTAIQTSATGIEQSVAATYSTKQATADAIAAIQVGGRNLITLAETYLGGVNQSTGADASVSATVLQRRSGYIPVTGGESYCAQAWLGSQGEQNVFIFWYRADKSYIGYKATPNVDTHATLVEVAPSDAAFARIQWRTFGNGWAKFEQGTLPTDYTAAPEDLVARPNLTPLGSHPLDDVYEATDNPDGYWAIRPSAAYVTQLADGWLHFERTNNGTAVVASNMATMPIPDVGDGELLTMLIEVRNNQSTAPTSGNPNTLYVQQANGAQLFGNTVQSANLTNDSAFRVWLMGESFEKRLTKVTDSDHKTGDYTRGFFINVQCGIGQTISFDFRVSVYRGGYEGGYVPYSIEDTTLSKTYTKSSTFVQTVDGLDGRITATEDGITLLDTLIRLFQGGVLAGYVGNAVSALMNAAGSFDVVQTTWADGEPTIADTLASFGASLVEIGKNSANAVIDFCAGGVRMAYDSVRAGFTILSSMRIYLLSEGNSTTNATLEATSVDEDTSVSRTASINAHASTGAGSQQIMLEVYEGNGATEYQSVALQSTGFKINSGTPIKGIYFGTKVAAPGNVTKFCVFTAAECATQFGRQLNAGKDFAILMNGDGAAYNGMMTASIQAGALYAQFPSARNANTRFNYLVILGA